MTRATGRTEECGVGQARTRLAHARAFLDAADLIGLEEDDLASDHVVAALSVLASIAASDAACCAALGQRSRGQDHRQAIQLVGQAGPDGKSLATAVQRLLNIKDSAHYGMVFVSEEQAKAAFRNATKLVEGAAKLC